MKTIDQKFCQECGELINIKAEICPKCGVRAEPINSHTSSTKEGQNKWIILLVLCWFLGVLGVHRFYTGHNLIGFLQLITLGFCGIWTLIDFIIIVTGNFKDSNGNYIKSS
jgi:RNA polymerase subunit RPABC4/transcription elongation factor Spt4